MSEPCRLCEEKAAGAWYVPSASGPPGKGPFAYVLLCAGHGAQAEKRGARKMAFVPRKARSEDERRVEDGVSAARDGQMAAARRRR